MCSQNEDRRVFLRRCEATTNNHRVPVTLYLPEAGFAAAGPELLRDRPLSMESKRRTDWQLPKGHCRSALERLVKRQHLNFILCLNASSRTESRPTAGSPNPARAWSFSLTVVRRRWRTTNIHRTSRSSEPINSGPPPNFAPAPHVCHAPCARRSILREADIDQLISQHS